MPVRINHNVHLQEIARSLSLHHAQAARQIEQLASGNRVNRSSDDPASLALADTISSEVRVLAEGNRNIQQSIHMLQTADGALGEINDMILRMRTLSVQAATANYQDRDRRNLNTEFQALRAEIDRVAEATEFNGIKLLNDVSTFMIQAGPTETSNDVTRLVLGNMRASGETLAITGHTVSTLPNAQRAMQRLRQAHELVVEERNRVAAFQRRLELSAETGLNIVERMRDSAGELRNVDIVQATTTMTQAQILAQVAASMGVSAHLDIDRVLSLLQ